MREKMNMGTKLQRESKVSSVGRVLWRASALATLAVACGGVLDTPRTSGESHFLRSCEKSCGGGLSCISNLCTRSCIVDQSSCTDLAKAAVCTDKSIEPGKVAVCDQPCERRSDCTALGPDFSCEMGFCRAPALSMGSGSGGSTSVSSGGTSMSSGGVPVPAGAWGLGGGGVPVPGGTWTGGGEPSEAGAGFGGSAGGDGEPIGSMKLFPAMQCPANAKSDEFDLIRHRLYGDVLQLEIGHTGGCAEHEYTLCYEGEFVGSSPVQVELRLLHNANGDTCQTYSTQSLITTLDGLAEAYALRYQKTSDIVLTTYGTYAFGTPECEARTRAASDQIAQALRWSQMGPPAVAHPTCASDDDCNWVSTNVSCSVGCGAPLGSVRTVTFERFLGRIDQHTCKDFSSSCPMLPQPPCAPPRALSCTGGECM